MSKQVVQDQQASIQLAISRADDDGGNEAGLVGVKAVSCGAMSMVAFRL